MKEFTHEIKVGLVAVAALFLFGFIVAKLRHGIGEKQGYEVVAVFSNIAGLLDQAPVRLAGVKVGEVVNIALRQDNRVEIRMRFRKDVRIPNDAYFMITTQSILAFDKYVEVGIPSHPSHTYLKGGEVLQGRDPIQASQLMEGIFETMNTFKKLSASLGDLLGDQEFMMSIKEAMLNVSDATAELKSFVEGLSSLTSERRSDLEKLIDNLVVISENGKEMSYRLKHALRGGKLESMQDDLQELLQEMKQAGKKTNVLLDKLNEEILSKKNTQKISSILDKGEKTLGKFDQAQKKLSQLQPSVEVESGYRSRSHLFDQNAYLKVKDKKSKFFVKGGVMHIGEGNKIVLQGGKEIGHVSLYGGIKEGKVGGGAGWEKKKGFVHLDLYDPNSWKWEIKGGYTFWTPFHLLGGVVKDTQSKDTELWFGVGLK